MKLRPSLKNLAKRGLLLSLFFSCLLLTYGCSLSTKPTYLKEDLDKAIKDICKKEYNLEVRVTLVGSTLWVYLPLEDIYVKADKPEKYLERFKVEENINEFKENVFRLQYLIMPIPEEEKYEEFKLDKKALEKINNVWRVLHRVFFSMERSGQKEPLFFCLVTADIKYGFLIQQAFHHLDLKKVSYEFISWEEFQHRTIQDTVLAPQIIADKEGNNLALRDITLSEFITNQIQTRIKLKFQKPEVQKNVDIDKEVIKAIVNTVKIYDFRDFSEVELNNLATNNKIVLNKAALLARPAE